MACADGDCARGLNEGVIIANDSHRILFANSRFVEMTGISGQELMEFDPSRFYSSGERDFLKQQIDVAFQAGHNRYAFVLPRKGGGRLPVIISSRTFQNSSNRFGIVTFTAILPLFPRRLQLPVRLGENLLLMPAEHVPRRDVVGV
jgi:PAS domain S-box-containing protein